MDVKNSTSGDTQIRPGGAPPPAGTGTGAIAIGPRPSRREPEPVWAVFAAGTTLHLPTPGSGAYPVEFRLPNGRTLVQVVDAHTTQVELVEDGDGTYRTVITRAPSQEVPARTAAGGRR